MTEHPRVTLPDQIAESLARDLPAFDWDGQIVPVFREMAPFIAPHCDEVCRIFWQHYLAHPSTAHVRAHYTDAQVEQEIVTSTIYMRSKFEDPLGRAWMEMACYNAKGSDRAGVSLAPLLAALTAAYQSTLGLLATACGEDCARMARYADVLQRVSFIEAHLLTGYISQLIQHRARKARQQSSQTFRESIAESIEGTAELGNKIRGQAARTSDSAKGMLDKTAEEIGRAHV